MSSHTSSDSETGEGAPEKQMEGAAEGEAAGEEKEVFTPQLYHSRWWTLFLFSILSLTNALTWITFAPIAVTVGSAYDVPAIAVNFLSMVFMIVFIPGAFPASWIVDNRSLRLGICVGALLNAGGALVRIAPWPLASVTDTAPWSFIPVAIGQTICALAQTFILAMPPKLAQNWFGERERVTATAVATLANQFGIAIGFFLSPAVVQGMEERVTDLLILQFAFCLIALVLVVCFFRSKPPTPPSHSANVVDVKMKLTTVLWELCRHRSYLVLVFCFGVDMGAFYAVSTLLGQILDMQGYEEKATSILGMVIIVMGIFGAGVCGVAADKTRQYKLLLVVFLVGSLLSMVWFTFAAVPDNEWMLLVCCAVLGWFMTGILPVSMDTSVEITYPLPAGITANVLVISAQVFGIIFIPAMTYALEHFSVFSACAIVTGTVGLACVAILFYKGENKRLLAEAAALPGQSPA